jgi:SAM-dependent methyltransferase
MRVIWHDLECGSYTADLALWEELTDGVEGPILDLGCGSGRVGLHLARYGHPVRGLDSDGDLVAAFNERANAAELPGMATVGDAREFSLGEKFGVAIAPMQLVQLLAGEGERLACLRCVAEHLRSGTMLAVAIVEEIPPPSDATTPPLPDARELDGWVYSSLPLDVTLDAGAIVVRRLRQQVSPAGELSEEIDEVRLQVLSADSLESEAEELGLRPIGRRAVVAGDAHVGSTVVLLEAP